MPPNLSVSQNDWDNLYQQFQNKNIIGGDFNCHHIMWRYQEHTHQPNLLVEVIIENWKSNENEYIKSFTFSDRSDLN